MKVQNNILSNLRKNENLILERFRYMDGKYQKLIDTKLVPLLQAYDIDIRPRPILARPAELIYRGFDYNYNLIDFMFSNISDELRSEEHDKYDMFLTIYYKGKYEKVGIIDLIGKTDLGESFSLITQALEDLGFKLKEEVKPEEKEEEDPDIKSLVDFKNSISGD